MSSLTESHVEDAALDWRVRLGWFVGAEPMEDDDKAFEEKLTQRLVRLTLRAMLYFRN